MSERYNYYFEQYDGDSFIYDIQTNEKIEYLSTCADLLNEHRLSNCIEPKYKAGQEVWHLLCENGVAKDVIEENYNVYSLKISRLGGLYEDLLFATEEEAKAKLREIQDGR